MKKGFLCIVSILFLCLFLTSAAFADKPYHIGIATLTVSQSEDTYRGAEYMVKQYGDINKGGMIKHVTMPDNFMQEMETTISQIAGLADDPKMKVIVVEGIPGTTEAFRRVKEKRKDIICLVGSPQEDPNVISAVADYCVASDKITRGYLNIYAAKKLGAKTFVIISFPRHMSYELQARRRAIFEEACKDLGLKYAFETAPDPVSDVGVAGAQQFILEKVPAWVDKYGKDTAFYCTNDAQTEPLLKQVAKYGAIFIEPDLPSPLMGYPGAFGIDLKKEAGNWPAILKKVEEAVIAAGGKGRMGTCAYSQSWTTVCALVEYGNRILNKEAELGNSKDLVTCFDKFTPGAKWYIRPYVELATGVKSKNYLLILQDTYIFGKGYLNLTDVKVPKKYEMLKK
ncbi:MAG: DUF3798 domain-containing protein [Clostridia bacterium]|nr:DUF3798 domain-containing protein [Clostridia bacterium]